MMVTIKNGSKVYYTLPNTWSKKMMPTYLIHKSRKILTLLFCPKRGKVRTVKTSSGWTTKERIPTWHHRTWDKGLLSLSGGHFACQNQRNRSDYSQWLNISYNLFYLYFSQLLSLNRQNLEFVNSIDINSLFFLTHFTLPSSDFILSSSIKISTSERTKQPLFRPYSERQLVNSDWYI